MNIHADKIQENRSQSANQTFQKKSGGGSVSQFVENCPKTIAQRKLQDMAHNGPRMRQLRAFEEMANNSHQSKQAALLQAMADDNSVMQSAIQLRRAYQGSNEVNPEFASGSEAFDRMVQYISLGVTSYTVGIGTEKVCDEAGELWEQSEAQEGMVRRYLAPKFKDKKRGWQANFWEKPQEGGKEIINLHLSMYK